MFSMKKYIFLTALLFAGPSLGHTISILINQEFINAIIANDVQTVAQMLSAEPGLVEAYGHKSKDLYSQLERALEVQWIRNAMRL